jgi:TfoX/Sxy family transcriptional regulator of competence genes
MAYDTELADRLLRATAHMPEITTRKMFGGFAVMWRGNMLAGVIGDDLMVRIGADAYEDALDQPGAATMEFTGKPMKGMVTVLADHVSSEEDVADWVERAVTFVETLPAK